jgi:hypothetical protein
VHVAAVAGADAHGAQLDALARQQVLQHVAGLAADCGAQHHRHAQRRDHPGLPHALPAGVDVDVRLPRPILDRDGEQR